MVVEGKSINVWGKGVFGDTSTEAPKPADLQSRVLREFFDEFDVAVIKQVVAGPAFSAILSDAGTVFTFGSERWFDPSAKDDAGAEPRFQKWDQIFDVIMVDVGETFIAALTDSGDLYTWGTGQYGQLGLDSVLSATTPQLVKSLEGNIKQVSCGYDSIAAVTKNGELYTWGRAQSGVLGHGNEQDMKTPTLVKSLDGITVSQVKVGSSHMAALTDDGIYTWGNNFLGPLGRILGKGKDSDFVPRPIDLVQVGAQVTEENLKGADEINFVQLECLRFNTLALSDEGQVFSCGKGGIDGGGHGDSPHTLFCLIEAIKDVKVKSIANCKANHVAVLAENGDVWTWGNGESGQLGLGETQSQAYPKRIESLSENKILQISCGETHTIAVSTVELDKEEIKKRREEKLASKKAGTSQNTPTEIPAATPASTSAPPPPTIYHGEEGQKADESDSSGDSESDDESNKKKASSPTPEQQNTESASTDHHPVVSTVETPKPSSDENKTDGSDTQTASVHIEPTSTPPQTTEDPSNQAETKKTTPPSTPTSPLEDKSKTFEVEPEPKQTEQPSKTNNDADDGLVDEPLEPESKPTQTTPTQDNKTPSSPAVTPEKDDDDKKGASGGKKAATSKGKDSDEEDSDEESKDAVGAADAASRGGHTGFLQKKGDKGLVKSWKKRFFVVDGDVIRYFANKGDKKEKGHIPIKDMVDLLEGSTKTGFNVVMRTKRIYELKASTEEEMEKWISVLKELIKAQKKK